MTTKPTAAQASRRILWIMVHRFDLRENGVLGDGDFLVSFPGDGFDVEDFQPGADFAVEQGWVE
jgi:hypothetical protein